MTKKELKVRVAMILGRLIERQLSDNKTDEAHIWKWKEIDYSLRLVEDNFELIARIDNDFNEFVIAEYSWKRSLPGIYVIANGLTENILCMEKYYNGEL